MKFVYREDDVRETIITQIFPEVPEKLTRFSLQQIAIAKIIKVNGEKMLSSCVLEADNRGVLVVHMHHFKVDKAIGYDYFAFSDLQGIRIKEGMLFYKMTFQFKDGRNYVIHMQKRNMKHLPNQRKNAEYIVTTLHEQHLHDMENPTFKKMKRQNRMMDFTYTSTLILTVVMTLFIGITYMPSKVLFFFMIFGAAILHFIIFSMVTTFFSNRKNRSFLDEYSRIMEQYQHTEDTEQLLNALQTMQHEPKSEHTENMFKLSLSTALYKTKQVNEALEVLDTIETTNPQIAKVVAEHRFIFEAHEPDDEEF